MPSVVIPVTPVLPAQIMMQGTPGISRPRSETLYPEPVTVMTSIFFLQCEVKHMPEPGLMCVFPANMMDTQRMQERIYFPSYAFNYLHVLRTGLEPVNSCLKGRRL
jgi:hypothetical protein